MNPNLAIIEADSVKLFPSINLPAHIPTDNVEINKKKNITINNPKYNKGNFNTQNSSKNLELPGLLRTLKNSIGSKAFDQSSADRTVIGFTASNLHLDSGEISQETGRSSIVSSSSQNTLSVQTFKLNTIHEEASKKLLNTINEELSTINDKKSIKKKKKKSASSENNEEVLNELRSYTTLMDRFSVNNFIIWNGKTLKSTPEFQSYRKTYNNEWGGISIIIKLLEEIMTNYEIKLAIINGYKVFELAMLNLPFHDRQDLIECVDNLEQIKPYLNSLREASKLNQQIRAAILLQSLLRRYTAMKDFRINKARNSSALVIQSRIRMFLYQKRARERMMNRLDNITEKWNQLQESYKERFTAQINAQKGSIARLFIHIPSIAASEYSRINFDHLQTIQNGMLTGLYQLVDPNVVLVYILPIDFGASEIKYIHRFLAGIGIQRVTNRLHFIIPELIHKLPTQMTISQMLWYSSGALRKIRRLIKTHPEAIIIPSSVTWVEKRIACYLSIPMMAPDSSVSESLTSKSMAKRVFMASKVNIPVGSHDINNQEDFTIAMSRLIASNLDVNQYKISMNYDFNNDSYALFDVNCMPILATLRKEMQTITALNGNNSNAWFSRPVQISARRRIISSLNAHFVKNLVICRGDKYPSWPVYLKFMSQVGGVIEALPAQPLGIVKGVCFIDPLGNVKTVPSGGINAIINERCQEIGTIYPQNLASYKALEGATAAVANYLYSKYSVVGYLTVSFTSFWDNIENIPKLCGESINFGMPSVVGVLGTLCVTNRVELSQHNPFFPEILSGNINPFIYFPLLHHTPLRNGRDDIFFKLCKVHGVAYDIDTMSGTLFPMLDSIVSGSFSVICTGNTRLRSFEIAQHTLSFVLQQFEKDSSAGKENYNWEVLTFIYKQLKFMLRKEKKAPSPLEPGAV